MTEIQYNFESKLLVPEGIKLVSILVDVAIVPASADCIIYGYNALGDIQPVLIKGSGRAELPFSNGQIYVKYGDGLEEISISTAGWRDSRGEP